MLSEKLVEILLTLPVDIVLELRIPDILESLVSGHIVTFSSAIIHSQKKNLAGIFYNCGSTKKVLP